MRDSVVNLVDEYEPDRPPVWIRILCNADLMKRKPHALAGGFYGTVYIQLDGTLVEVWENFDD